MRHADYLRGVKVRGPDVGGAGSGHARRNGCFPHEMRERGEIEPDIRLKDERLDAQHVRALLMPRGLPRASSF
jgi:hypothetical protein